MKLEAGNLPAVERADVAIRCRDLLQRLNGVNWCQRSEFGFCILGRCCHEEGVLGVGRDAIEAAVADGAAAAARKVGAGLDVAVAPGAVAALHLLGERRNSSQDVAVEAGGDAYADGQGRCCHAIQYSCSNIGIRGSRSRGSRESRGRTTTAKRLGGSAELHHVARCVL
jgi:hypothetical protein